MVNFLCQRSIPEHILNLPQIAMANPILRPFLESMSGAVQHGAGTLDPFATTSQQLPRSTPPACPSLNRASEANHGTSAQPVELEDRPVVSAEKDATLLRSMARKLSMIETANKTDEKETLSATDKLSIVTAIEFVITGAPLTPNLLEVFYRVLVHHPAGQVPALFVLRLAALGERNFSDASHFASIIELLIQWMLAPNDGGGNGEAPTNAFTSVSALTLGISVLMNCLSHASGTAILLHHSNKIDADNSKIDSNHLLDASCRALMHPKPEAKLMAGSLVYNIALRLTAMRKNPAEEPSSHLVQILCTVLELVTKLVTLPQSDPQVTVRFLSILCLLLRSGGASMAALVVELGFADGLAGLRLPPGSKERRILDEVASYVRAVVE